MLLSESVLLFGSLLPGGSMSKRRALWPVCGGDELAESSGGVVGPGEGGWFSD